MAIYCEQCGTELGTGANFCGKCGHKANGKRLFVPAGLVRPQAGRMIAGVCAGLSRYYGWELTVVRLVAVITLFCSGAGFWVYVIGWIVMPNEEVTMVAPPPPPSTTS